MKTLVLVFSLISGMVSAQDWTPWDDVGYGIQISFRYGRESCKFANTYVRLRNISSYKYCWVNVAFDQNCSGQPRASIDARSLEPNEIKESPGDFFITNLNVTNIKLEKLQNEHCINILVNANGSHNGESNGYPQQQSISTKQLEEKTLYDRLVREENQRRTQEADKKRLSEEAQMKSNNKHLEQEKKEHEQLSDRRKKIKQDFESNQQSTNEIKGVVDNFTDKISEIYHREQEISDKYNSRSDYQDYSNSYQPSVNSAPAYDINQAVQLFDEGLLLSLDENYKDAKLKAIRSAELYPFYTKAVFLKAACEYKLGELSASVADFKKYLNMEPEDNLNHVAFFFLGQAQYLLGNFSDFHDPCKCWSFYKFYCLKYGVDYHMMKDKVDLEKICEK